jgi:hypothetical protein
MKTVHVNATVITNKRGEIGENLAGENLARENLDRRLPAGS